MLKVYIKRVNFVMFAFQVYLFLNFNLAFFYYNNYYIHQNENLQSKYYILIQANKAIFYSNLLAKIAILAKF